MAGSVVKNLHEHSSARVGRRTGPEVAATAVLVGVVECDAPANVHVAGGEGRVCKEERDHGVTSSSSMSGSYGTTTSRAGSTRLAPSTRSVASSTP